MHGRLGPNPDPYPIEAVARRLLGDPNPQLSSNSQLRYGNHGSLVVEIEGDKKGLWYDHENTKGGGVIQLVMAHLDCSPKEAAYWLKTEFRSQLKADEIYDYVDADGNLVFQVLRQFPKKFLQRRPDGKDAWVYNTKNVRKYPYRLPEVLNPKNDLILIVEGEKDVEALRAIGFVATTNAGGAIKPQKNGQSPKWPVSFNQYFAGKKIVIIPDNDSAGQTHATFIAAQLRGSARQIGILKLPDLPDKGDVSDWLGNEGNKRRLWELAMAALNDGRQVSHPPSPVTASWYDEAMVGARGQVLPNLANVLSALRHDPAWEGIFAYDEMRHCVMLLGPLPRHGPLVADDSSYPRPWEDRDDIVVQEWMQIASFPNVALGTVHDAIVARAYELRVHPLRDYLNRLEWDGVPRISGGTTAEGDVVEPFFPRYFDAKANPYTKTVGECFLISAVARIMDPGCQADHMLILEGKQGIGKSTASRILAGSDYFSDTIPRPGTKDAMSHLEGLWIGEISELDSFSRADVSGIKAFVSGRSDKFRPAYGRKERHQPRQCIFIGTTNSETYLKDETGGRRFWPIKCKNIDLEALETDRDQIWAEAVNLYKLGRPWHITDPATRELAEEEQTARYDEDVWHNDIAVYLEKKNKVTVSDVLSEALFIEKAKMDRASQNRVTKALTRLGWSRGPRTGTKRWWYPQTSEMTE